MLCCCCYCQVVSVVSDSVWPHRRQPTRLPCPWDSPAKNTGVGCHFLLQGVKVKSESEVAGSCPTLSDPMDCSLPGSAIHGIFQARVLKWVAIAFSNKILESRPLFPDGCHIADVQYLLNELSCLEISTFVSPPWCGYWTCYHIWALVCGVDDGWTGRPGMLRFMGWQIVEHDWATELSW